MKRRSLFLLLTSLITVTAWTTPISESQARNIAANFMAQHLRQTPSMKLEHKATRISATGNVEKMAYYVFNANQGGYVIIAGDDRAPAVLGYSDRGSFDSQDVPPAMQELLESYADQMAALDQGAVAAPPFTAQSAIAPLLSSSWSQGNPYNVLLPHVDGSSNYHAYVGCVATAMAQVMYYWKWPQDPTTSIPAYVTSSNSIEMPSLPSITFEWELMKDTYLTNDTASAEALAVARLSQYCAQAVEMDFKASASGAKTINVAKALPSYFGYKASAHLLDRENYSTQEWCDIIYSELVAGRPVVYAGHKATSGHAYVCDGYDGNGLFHINWGWNGNSNGYFVLNVLNPDIQGTGSAAGAYGYVYTQSIVVGVEPGEGDSVFFVTVEDATLDEYTSTRTSANGNFTATVSAHFFNHTAQTLAMEYGWGLYQDDNMLSKLWSSYHNAVPSGFFMNAASKQLSFGSGLANGTYRLVPICSPRYANDWRPCAGANINYIEVIIDGNNCTFTGYGSAGVTNYTVNNISVEGTMHPNRPIDINVNLTNEGQTSNKLLHMFVDGTFTATGFVGLEPGETGDIPFSFQPTSTGNYTLTFSFNSDGSDPIASRTIVVNAMPTASLTASVTVFNSTTDYVINDNKFSITLAITNNGSNTYDEDIYVKLYKNIYGNTGSAVQGKNQRLTLAPGETKTLQFDMDNVIDGWRYFVTSYYYSNGSQQTLKGTSNYTIVFPEVPEFILGDVNNDQSVDIMDVTNLIDYLLGGGTINEQAADVKTDGLVNIADITSLIDLILSGH